MSLFFVIKITIQTLLLNTQRKSHNLLSLIMMTSKKTIMLWVNAVVIDTTMTSIQVLGSKICLDFASKMSSAYLQDFFQLSLVLNYNDVCFAVVGNVVTRFWRVGCVDSRHNAPVKRNRHLLTPNGLDISGCLRFFQGASFLS